MIRIPEVTKRPDEMFAIGLRYISPDLEEGGSIFSATVTISPDTPLGLKKSGNVVVEPEVVSQMIYGGEDGSEYYVTFQVLTSGGHTYEDSIFVKVRSI